MLRRNARRRDYSEYAPGWNRFPLSASPSRKERTHDGPKVAAFLRDLLPETQGIMDFHACRYRIADFSDPRAILAELGQDAPGAFDFASAPAGNRHSTESSTFSAKVRPWTGQPFGYRFDYFAKSCGSRQ